MMPERLADANPRGRPRRRRDLATGQRGRPRRFQRADPSAPREVPKGSPEHRLPNAATLNELDPWAYLAPVLARIVDHPVDGVEELPPWHGADAVVLGLLMLPSLSSAMPIEETIRLGLEPELKIEAHIEPESQYTYCMKLKKQASECHPGPQEWGGLHWFPKLGEE